MSVEAINQLNEVFRVFSASNGVIRPHAILTGPSGSGKSHNVLALADVHGLNYIEVNAAQLTKEGLSGNSLSKALSPLANFGNAPTICFIDEFDKLFISGNSNSDLAHESTNGVQNELLKALESRTTSVFGDYGKYREITIDKVLFIFAGAFNGEEDLDVDRLREMGMKTELLGRVGLVFNMTKLSLDEMKHILDKSELLSNYLDLYDCERDEVVKVIMEALQESYDNNTLGARLITTLLHQYFLNGGKLPEKVKKATSFQTKLKLAKQGESK